MSAGIWLYDPQYCDGHECYKDCDKCPYKELIFEAEEEEDEKVY